MKYKVGDKVRIKSLDWYNENKDEDGDVPCSFNTLFVASNKKYLGTIQTIEHVYKCKGRYTNNYIYHMTKIDNVDWTNDMIEGLVEEEVFIKANDIYNEEYSKGEYCHEQSFKWGFQEGYNYSHENDKLEISLKEGYIFKDENGNVINTYKIVLEKKKKKEYPKSLAECLEVLGYTKDALLSNKKNLYSYSVNRLADFQQLLICRDAYWKIYGEDNDLGKPWEPDWSDYENIKYIIGGYDGEIGYDQNHHIHKILAFPTEEMRDAFYENFKEEIEICKELL